MDEKMELSVEDLDQVSGGNTMGLTEEEYEAMRFLRTLMKKYNVYNTRVLAERMNEEEKSRARELHLMD